MLLLEIIAFSKIIATFTLTLLLYFDRVVRNLKKKKLILIVASDARLASPSDGLSVTSKH